MVEYWTTKYEVVEIDKKKVVKDSKVLIGTSEDAETLLDKINNIIEKKENRPNIINLPQRDKWILERYIYDEKKEYYLSQYFKNNYDLNLISNIGIKEIVIE